MKFIKSRFVDKEKNIDLTENYKTIKEAAAAIDTPMENWKVQLLIADAIVGKKKAFKRTWKLVKI